MSEKKDGGPTFCGKAGCESLATHRQGHQLLCPRHYRFGQMRAKAKQDGKAVPTLAVLEELAEVQGGYCADCAAPMNWLARAGQASVATLQHYRDRTFALVCRSCNTRHAYMPGDTYRAMPKDHKYCPHCKTAKPVAEFSADRGRSGPLKLKSWCKECSHRAHTDWRVNNRDHYNAKQREGRARRAGAH